MKTKHTPGPWEMVIKKYTKNPKEIIMGVGFSEKLNTGTYTTFICNTVLPDTDSEYIKQHEQIKADMKLIAAAPDLLEALQNIENDAKTIPESIWKMRNDAIEKATK